MRHRTFHGTNGDGVRVGSVECTSVSLESKGAAEIAPVYRPRGSHSRHYLAPGEELWVYAYPSDGCGTESVGCKSLIPNLRCGLRYTAETPSEGVEVNKKLLSCRGAGERMGASALRGYVGEDVSKSQIVGIGEHGHTYTVFTVLLRQRGNGNAIRSRPPPVIMPPSLSTLMHANQKSREGVINRLVFGTGERGGVSLFCGTPTVGTRWDHEVPLEVSLLAR